MDQTCRQGEACSWWIPVHRHTNRKEVRRGRMIIDRKTLRDTLYTLTSARADCVPSKQRRQWLEQYQEWLHSQPKALNELLKWIGT